MPEQGRVRMSGNELYEPLTGNPSGRGRRRTFGVSVSICAAVPLLVVASVLAVEDDGVRGGEPQAVAMIERQSIALPAVSSALPGASGPAMTGAIAPAPRPQASGGAEPAPHAGQSVRNPERREDLPACPGVRPRHDGAQGAAGRNRCGAVRRARRAANRARCPRGRTGPLWAAAANRAGRHPACRRLCAPARARPGRRTPPPSWRC